MAFQTPIPIAKAIKQISRGEYVLPAIQREFVWRPAQITTLFDSLMRDYPIGTFLFWKVRRTNWGQYQFYRFLDSYHQRNKRHNIRIDVIGNDEVIAVLDGQQRLTSLYIGLRGTYAWKIKYGRWNNPAAFPERSLYLNLLQPADRGSGLNYDFRFLTDRDLKTREATHWFPVGRILEFRELRDVYKYLRRHGLFELSEYPEECLYKLYSVINTEKLINYYLEEDQDLDKVLNIFIRVNSGGTVLNYSDLLLSIATSQWTNIDARQAIHGLVDDLNRIGTGFGFDKDLVLKSCLVLADIPDIGFRVRNFTRQNSEKIESAWPRIAQALRLAVLLISRFGHSQRTLRARNVLIPVAYYLYSRRKRDSFITSKVDSDDRLAIRSWVTRALLKRGTFGAGLDTTLRTTRATIQQNSLLFPEHELDLALARIGRGLRFEEEELDDLLDQGYGSSLSFLVLTLLYPAVDLANQFHEDHVFPKGRFSRNKLLGARVTEEQIAEYQERRDRIANLQLLEEQQNLEKSKRMPGEWLRCHYKSDDEIDAWRRRNYVDQLPEEMTGFLEFYESRRRRMKKRLASILGVSLGSSSAAEE